MPTLSRLLFSNARLWPNRSLSACWVDAVANSRELEADARAVNTYEDGAVQPAEIAIGVVIGRTSEFFDFFVYAIASVIVFPQLMFPYVDRLTGTTWCC